MKTVLVVEDDHDVREVEVEILRRHGYMTDEARDGSEALEKIAKAKEEGRTVDLILLDISMPRMSGWQFLSARLRDPATAGTPIIVVSGTAGAEVGVGVTTVVACLFKPVDLHALLRVVARTLAEFSESIH